MAAPRKWTDEQLDQARVLYEQEGLAAAVRQTGIPKGTIASLVHREGLHTFALANTQEATAQMQAKRALSLEIIKVNWAEVALHMQERAMQEEQAKDAYSATLSGAIATDKLLLMSGEATSRHETRGDLDRTILDQLVRAERHARSADGRIRKPDVIEAESRTA